jgi:hypothetical protein
MVHEVCLAEKPSTRETIGKPFTIALRDGVNWAD